MSATNNIHAKNWLRWIFLACFIIAFLAIFPLLQGAEFATKKTKDPSQNNNITYSQSDILDNSINLNGVRPGMSIQQKSGSIDIGGNSSAR